MLHAQCNEWSHEFALSGFDGAVLAYASAPSAQGPLLYVGGAFRHVDELAAGSIACWDGAHWKRAAGDFDGNVTSLALFDDGSGPALYAGGNFSSVSTGAGTIACPGIARFDGVTWSAVGSSSAGLGNGIAFALHTLDLGTGPALYVAGNFSSADGLPAQNLARFTSAGWEALGAGTDGPVYALASLDEGGAPRLALGGMFTHGGAVAANGVALYDGSAYQALSSGILGTIRTLCVHDDGSGPALVAGGSFSAAGGVAATNIAAWAGGAWQALGSGLAAGVESLAVYDDGSGPRLFAGGRFGYVGALERWNGSTWDLVGSADVVDISDAAQTPTLFVHDDGSGARLCLGTGARVGPDLWTHGLSRWNGQAFESFGPFRNNTLLGTADQLSVCDDGSGPALLAAGMLSRAGGIPVNSIARWNGSHWSAMANGISVTIDPPVGVHEGASRPIYVTTIGGGSELRRWNGANWSSVFSSKGAFLGTLCAYDDGNGEALYVGGSFSHLDTVFAAGIARFDGTNFTPLGSGLTDPGHAAGANVIRSLDLGTGPMLVAGGSFTLAGGLPAQHVALWNGSSWSALGTGLDSIPNEFAVCDHGAGPVLYAACSQGPLGTLARWDGATWSSVPQGPDGSVQALAAFDDGTGTQLYAGGQFTHAGGSEMRAFARWNGTQWSALPGGLADGNSAVTLSGLCVFDDGQGSGPDLYLGGSFASSGGVLSRGIAKWNGCVGPIGSLCFGDGSAIPCPCANEGAAGHGCANSGDAQGALLAWSGETGLDTLALTSSGQVASALSIFLQGDALLPHTLFGEGLRCTGGVLRRLYIRTAVGGIVSAPIAGEPSIRARANALGDSIAPGATRYYQVYFRDVQAAFCPIALSSRFNVSNGIVVHW
ncbi:MAG: hypothetical protein IPJ19_08665 [Planctomycetes bacterium]|nr:hypothetical protein [Planctomycetota bacterium]